MCEGMCSCGFGVEDEDSEGGDPPRNNEDEDGDDWRDPGWWKSWPSGWCADITSVAMVELYIDMCTERRSRRNE